MQEGWWRRPLLVTAPVDARFDALRRIAAADHLHPRDLLVHKAASYASMPAIRKKSELPAKVCARCGTSIYMAQEMAQ